MPNICSMSPPWARAARPPDPIPFHLPPISVSLKRARTSIRGLSRQAAQALTNLERDLSSGGVNTTSECGAWQGAYSKFHARERANMVAGRPAKALVLAAMQGRPGYGWSGGIQ